MYPINRVIKHRVEELGLTKKEIAIKMGYKNLEKGISKIHDLIYRDYHAPFFLKNFLEAVPVDEYVIELAVDATDTIISLKKSIETAKEINIEEESYILLERSVSPYLIRITETKISPFMFKSHNFTWVKPFLIQPHKDELCTYSKNEIFAIVKDFIKADILSTGGIVPEAGKILGYYFIRDYRTAYQLDLEGNILRDRVTLVMGQVIEWWFPD
ncbi:MAG: hypothetical protein IPN18_15400 [Ignavibacteriales bacterium]|nr:hypothetical protein [Ignavibacteriales bacterium]